MKKKKIKIKKKKKARNLENEKSFQDEMIRGW